MKFLRSAFRRHASIRIAFASLLLLLTAAACGRIPENYMFPSEDGPHLDKEGIVLFRAYGRSADDVGNWVGDDLAPLLGGGNQDLRSAIRPVIGQKFFYGFGKWEEYQAYHVPAGVYMFQSFIWGSRVPVPDKLPLVGYSLANHIPVRPFEIKAGEIICMGTLFMDGIDEGYPISQFNKSVTFNVIDDCNGARVALNKKYPSVNGVIKKRLFVLDRVVHTR